MNCPECGYVMVLEKFRGVEIEVCHEHGVWLDRGELEKIESKIKGRANRRIARRLASDKSVTRAKLEGMVFGWISLLWD